MALNSTTRELILDRIDEINKDIDTRERAFRNIKNDKERQNLEEFREFREFQDIRIDLMKFERDTLRKTVINDDHKFLS